MAKCAVCGKGAHFGNNVSHSHRRSNRMFKSNIKSVRCKVNGGTKTQYVCARCPTSVCAHWQKDLEVRATVSRRITICSYGNRTSKMAEICRSRSGVRFAGCCKNAEKLKKGGVWTCSSLPVSL